MKQDIEDQEARIITFYKVHKADWARPLQRRLEGNGTSTLLFEGQVDHLIPCTSQVLVQSDLFKMAGRMIGYSFLHRGLSPAVLHVLLGGSRETTTLVLEDVADIDIRETIQLKPTKLGSYKVSFCMR
ncbi:hypothetical protein NQZ68_016919 [Dissostichus eleginoides]|nr:hypothetical protein NQZ68_016919 [Dissostichus eleginoides]